MRCMKCEKMSISILLTDRPHKNWIKMVHTKLRNKRAAQQKVKICPIASLPNADDLFTFPIVFRKSACYIQSAKRSGGGIGRRAGFRIQCLRDVRVRVSPRVRIK